MSRMQNQKRRRGYLLSSTEIKGPVKVSTIKVGKYQKISYINLCLRISF